MSLQTIMAKSTKNKCESTVTMKGVGIEGGLKCFGKFHKKSIRDKPLVSIITVCLNSETHLEQTIQSVIAQTYNNIEYLIIDGGSTDKTLEIVTRYNSFIAYWKSEYDNGIFDAMNKGISFATGDWIGILNSDDFYHVNAVKWIMEAARLYPDVDIFHGNMLVETVPGEYAISAGSHENLLDNFSLKHPTCFIENNIYHNHGFDTRFSVNADYDLLLKLYYEGKKFCYLNMPITFFRQTGISNRPSLTATWDRYRIRKKYNAPLALKRLATDMKSYLDECFVILSKQLDAFLLRSGSPWTIRFLSSIRRLAKSLWHLVLS
jgi:glycosyltransferase involved in cell wall biosynthesis